MKQLDSWSYGAEWPAEDNDIDFFYKRPNILQKRFKDSLMFGMMGKIVLGFLVVAMFPVVLFRRKH